MRKLVQLVWRVPILLLSLGLVAPAPPVLASGSDGRPLCTAPQPLSDDVALYGTLSSLLGPEDLGPGWVDLGGGLDVDHQLGEAYYRRSFAMESGGRVRQLTMTVTIVERPQAPPLVVQPVGTVIRGSGTPDVQVIEGPPVGEASMWQTSLLGPIESIFGLQAIALLFHVSNTRVVLALRSDDLSAQAATMAIADVANVVAQRLGWPPSEQCGEAGRER